MRTTTDLPFRECIHRANALIHQGFRVYQKFTCDGCGNRLTIETPNSFHRTGVCDNCPTVTNIEDKGCGFMAVGGPHGAY
jgi:hypothetical protein